MSAAQAFLTGLAAAINADATLKTLLEAGRGVTLSAPLPVYLAVAPPDEPWPFLTFNIVADNAWDVSDGIGSEIIADVHIWTQAASPASNYALAARVEKILTDPAWALTAANLVFCRVQSRRCNADDGQSFHGTVTVRALVEV